MAELQTIDLILSIVVKAVFIIFLIVLAVILIKINKSVNGIKNRIDMAVTNVESTADQIKNELTIDNLMSKVKGTVETAVQVYLINGVRKELFSFGRRLLK